MPPCVTVWEHQGEVKGVISSITLNNMLQATGSVRVDSIAR